MPDWVVLSDIDCPSCLERVLDHPALLAGMTTERAARWAISVHGAVCDGAPLSGRAAKVAQR